ncbi:MAG: signal peptidase I [Flavobacteriaceae bacterium]
MNVYEWLIFFLGVQLLHFAGTWKLYQKAGHAAWKAAVPVYNAIILLRIIKKPFWWVFLLFIPTINLIVFPALWVETLRAFGKSSWKDTLLVTITLGLWIIPLNYNDQTVYIERPENRPPAVVKEWFSSLLFAIVAATLVHNYFFQPFIIPTGSLEKSLLIGDFLIVSKMHYGPRVPMTTVSFPMVHDSLPLVKTRSYLKKPQLPYLRLPGFQKVKPNDIVVFSWPADTVRQFFVKEKGVRKPIDKKSNYVKRCVGIPGDTLEIINGFVYRNGQKNELPERAEVQYMHTAYAATGISSRKLLQLGLKEFTRRYAISNITQNSFNALLPYIVGRSGSTPEDFAVFTPSAGLPIEIVRQYNLKVLELLEKEKQLNLTLEEAQELQKKLSLDSLVRRVAQIQTPNETFFPNKIPYDWNEDNFGPIVLPKAGMTVGLNRSNIPLYKKIIVDYEKNTLEYDPEGFRINGTIQNEYTFQQDYYWMMGDNRHQSEDSRYWGFVPEDHIVGKPVFIWMSLENFNSGFKNWKVRWDRVFTTVSGTGKRVSYFPYAFAVFVIWQVISFIRKRRGKKTV